MSPSSSRRSPRPTLKTSCADSYRARQIGRRSPNASSEAAGGNPLFIEELAAWLSEGDTANAAGVPANIKTIIAARLDQLPAAERQVILDASVIGDFFWQGTLEALGSDGTLVETLYALERRGLIRHSPSSRIHGDQELIFKHGLIREVAYATLAKAARRERHAVVARFVEQAAGDPTRLCGDPRSPLA